MNIINIIGNLTRDPEIKYSNDTAIANFRVAYNDYVKGEERTYFFNVSAFGRTAEVLEQYARKGHRIGISGKLTMENYTDRNGVEVSNPRIVASNITLLTPRSDDTDSKHQTNRRKK